MAMKLGLNLLLLVSLANSLSVEVPRANCPPLESDEKSLSAATCKFCQDGRDVRSAYIASLSPKISASPHVSFEESSYSVEGDPNDRKFKLYNVSIDLMSAEATVYWTKKPVRFSMKTCMPIRFCLDQKLLDASIQKAEHKSILVVTQKIEFLPEALEEICDKRLMIGTLVGKSLSLDTIREIVKCGAHVLSNLRLPDDFKDTHNHKGHLFVFSPLDSDTSIPKSDDEDLSANLAQLIITSADRLLCGKSMRTVRLNHEWSPRIPNLGNVPRPYVDPDTNRFNFNDHYGTHLDFGTLFLPGGKLSADNHPICRSLGACAKVRAFGFDRNEPVPLNIFLHWEARNNQKLPEMVFIETGCGEHHAYNQDKYVSECPGISPEAIEFLLTNRSVKVIGTDSVLLDRPADRWKLPSHLTVAMHDAIGLVGLRTSGLDQLMDAKESICLLSYFRLEGGTGSPAAVVAFQNEHAHPYVFSVHNMADPSSPADQSMGKLLSGGVIIILLSATLSFIIFAVVLQFRRSHRDRIRQINH